MTSYRPNKRGQLAYGGTFEPSTAASSTVRIRSSLVGLSSMPRPSPYPVGSAVRGQSSTVRNSSTVRPASRMSFRRVPGASSRWSGIDSETRLPGLVRIW
jgi:hypothetical protein